MGHMFAYVFASPSIPDLWCKEVDVSTAQKDFLGTGPTGHDQISAWSPLVQSGEFMHGAIVSRSKIG